MALKVLLAQLVLLLQGALVAPAHMASAQVGSLIQVAASRRDPASVSEG